MVDLLTSAQLDALLHLLASSRPFHLLSESFHSSFDRTVRYKAVLVILALLYESDPQPIKPAASRPTEEKKEDMDKGFPAASPDALSSLSSSASSSSSLSASRTSPHSASSLVSALSSVLRSGQRLAGVFVLYDFVRAELALSADALLSAQQAQAMLLMNPFLSHLLHHVDALDVPTGPAMAAERQLTVRLLLHQQLAAIRQRSAKDFLDAFKPDRFSNQSVKHAERVAKGGEPASVSSELSAMLQPLRAFVQARLPPPPPSLSSYRALSSTRGVKPPSAPTTPVSARSAASSVSPPSFVDDARASSPSPPQPSVLTGPLAFDQLSEHMQRAQRAQLSSGERHAVVEALTSAPTVAEALVQHGLGPQQLPSIIEKNPAIAVAFLHVLLSQPLANPDLTAVMLSPLLHLDLSLHSMEVVNRLASSPLSLPSPPYASVPSPQSSLLPGDFLPAYVHHALECCRVIRDKYAQSRMVRLVCVFLQSLLRGHRGGGLVLGLDGLLSELMAFCVEFSKVKEAAALFRILKEWEAEDG